MWLVQPEGFRGWLGLFWAMLTHRSPAASVTTSTVVCPRCGEVFDR